MDIQKKYYLIQEDFDKIKHTMRSLNAETVGIGSSDKNIDFDITLGSDNDLITVTINNGDVFIYYVGDELKLDLNDEPEDNYDESKDLTQTLVGSLRSIASALE